MTNVSRSLAAVLLALSLWPAAAQEPATDPAAAGPDYAVQGEYLGDLTVAGVTRPLGVQIAARGDGKFTATFLPGGLPGAGWDGQTLTAVNGARAGDQVVFEGQGWKVTLAGEGLTGTNPDGVAFTLRKTVRVSPTLGATAPAGATVLFDGTNVDAWAKGLLDPRGWLGVYSGEKGVRAGAITKQSFGSFTLHLEFMTPFMPKASGQGRANSGVYLQDRYEVQVLDSFGFKQGQSNGNGDVAGDIYHKAGAPVNACLPPLTWQTYDIDFTAAEYDAAGQKVKPARATVRLNGVLLHQDQAIDGVTGGNGHREGPEPAPLMLQDHGYPLFFRNLWIVPR